MLCESPCPGLKALALHSMASIMSISWEGFGGMSARRPSMISISWRGLVVRQGGQDHEH